MILLYPPDLQLPMCFPVTLPFGPRAVHPALS